MENADKKLHDMVIKCIDSKVNRKKASQIIEWLPYCSRFQYMFARDLVEKPWWVGAFDEMVGVDFQVRRDSLICTWVSWLLVWLGHSRYKKPPVSDSDMKRIRLSPQPTDLLSHELVALDKSSLCVRMPACFWLLPWQHSNRTASTVHGFLCLAWMELWKKVIGEFYLLNCLVWRIS